MIDRKHLQATVCGAIDRTVHGPGGRDINIELPPALIKTRWNVRFSNE